MYQVFENASTPAVLIHQLLNLSLIVVLTLVVCQWARRKLKLAPETQHGTAAQSINELLREKRMKSGMSQEFVAEQLKVSRQAVSKWENGTTMPSAANLLALVKLLQIPVDMLIRNSSEQ